MWPTHCRYCSTRTRISLRLSVLGSESSRQMPKRIISFLSFSLVVWGCWMMDGITNFSLSLCLSPFCRCVMQVVMSTTDGVQDNQLGCWILAGLVYLVSDSSIARWYFAHILNFDPYPYTMVIPRRQQSKHNNRHCCRRKIDIHSLKRPLDRSESSSLAKYQPDLPTPFLIYIYPCCLLACSSEVAI